MNWVILYEWDELWIVAYEFNMNWIWWVGCGFDMRYGNGSWVRNDEF